MNMLTILRPSENNCPQCGNALDEINVQYSYKQCQVCNYAEESLRLDLVGNFALGAILGFLIYKLIDSEQLLPNY